MKLMVFFLSLLTIPYGISFSGNLPLPIKIVTRLFFLLSLLDQFYMLLKNSGETLISTFGYLTFFFSNILFGTILIFRGRKIVDFIIENIHLMNSKQYKLIMSSLLLFLLEMICLTTSRFFSSVLPLIINLSTKSEPGPKIKEKLAMRLFRTCFYIYYFWVTLSGIIYGLMYLMMHLKHMKLLSTVSTSKCHSYVTWFNVVRAVKSDYEHFDHLVSLFPTVWIISIFINTSSALDIRSLSNIYTIMFLVQDYFCYPIVLLYIHKLHSSFAKSVDQITLSIALSDYLSNSSKDQLVKLLEQLLTPYVTASSFFRLDKSFVLPFIGSLFTFSILFRENFSSSSKNIKLI